MSSMAAAIHISLPDWIGHEIDMEARHDSDAEKVALAIRLSRLNVEHGTGGPFGAVLFGPDNSRPLSVGVNCVTGNNCSIAHAEIVALACAQQALGRYRLNMHGGCYTLAASSQPCSMCRGALTWAGIDRLLCGARTEDVEQTAGFDEGHVPHEWKVELEKRGVAVVRDIQRSDARAVLDLYRATKGIIY